MSPIIAPRQERTLLGIGLVISAFCFFALIDTCAKLMVLAGIPSLQVAFIRYGSQLVIVSAILLPVAGPTLLRTRRPALEIARGLSLMSATVLNFFALAYLPLAVTSSIQFTLPLMICALSMPLLGEPVGWRRWLAIAVGFSGMLIIVQPGTEAFHPAAILVLGAALSTAFYQIITRKLAGVDSVSTQQFYAALVGSVCLAPFALMVWTWPADPLTWFAFFAIGVVALIGHQIFTIAHRFAPASVLAPFSYSHIFPMSLLSWLVFGQPPDASIYLGAPIVIGSGLYIWLRERQLARQPVVTATAPPG
jgi:drug/metabolite transporter (DMT)-like permease